VDGAVIILTASSDDLVKMFEPLLEKTFQLVRQQNDRIKETQPKKTRVEVSLVPPA
jgi:hypothetical protein